MKTQNENIMQYLYTNMFEHNIVNNTVQFSLNICGKYKDYHAVTKLNKADLNLDTTINCILNIRKLLKIYNAQNSKLGYIHSEKITCLEECEEKLFHYLRTKFRVKDIVDPDDPDYINENDDPDDDNYTDYYPVII